MFKPGRVDRGQSKKLKLPAQSSGRKGSSKHWYTTWAILSEISPCAHDSTRGNAHHQLLLISSLLSRVYVSRHQDPSSRTLEPPPSRHRPHHGIVHLRRDPRRRYSHHASMSSPHVPQGRAKILIQGADLKIWKYPMHILFSNFNRWSNLIIY